MNLRLIIALWLMFTSGLHAGKQANIVIILSDDMGYSDIGCFGGEIPTPNLDALAAEGLRFTQCYNTARCCPTRASLLTGLYPHQAGIGHMVDAWSERAGESYAGDLSPKSVTIAEALNPVGYRSYAVGKWHVTPHGPDIDKHNWPLQRGFDRYYGTIHGAGSFFDPNTLVRDNTFISPFADAEYRPTEFYYTDAISDHAVRFIHEHAKQHTEKPFFLYVAYTAAHWPMHAKKSDLAKHRGRYDAGYDAIRAARWEKAKRLGVADASWTLTKQSGEWDKVKDKAFEARCMEVYAAMVDCMDQGIGRIVTELKVQGMFENTLVCYLQDNGGCAESTGRGKNATTRVEHPTLPPMPKEALQPDMIPKQTRDGFPVRQGHGVLPGGADTFIGYGQGWANVSNTPFREYKHWVHEGGISTPLVAHWPAGIAAARVNGLEKAPVHLVDLMATALDLAGAAYPQERAGVPVKPRQGVSLRLAFEGKAIERAQPIFFEHEGNKAVRDGQWKLVAKHNSPWELYDMESDRTETNDLSSQHPEKVAAMSAQWSGWAKDVGVLEWPIKAK